MNEPPRLTDVGNDPFERALLRSARRDRGSKAAERRCLTVITATAVMATSKISAAATITTASTTTTTVSALPAASVTGIGASTATLGVGYFVKAIAIGFSIGLGVQGVIVAKNKPTGHSLEVRVPEVRPRDSGPTLEHTTRDVPPVASFVEAETVPSSRVEQIQQRERQLLLPRNQDTSSGNSRSGMPQQNVSDDVPFAEVFRAVGRNDSLDREVALLDEARSAVLASNYSRTIRLVERYQLEFPSGTLGPEAIVLYVRALLGLGRRAEAEALVRRVGAVKSNLPISKRLTSLVGNAQ